MGFADELLIIHRVVTRALGVAYERGRQYAEHGFPDATAEKGYRNFGRCTVRLVKVHHEGEEEIFFPKLRPLMSSVPFAELEAQHEELLLPLEAAGAALDSADAGEAPAAWLDRFIPAIDRVRAAWTAHIAAEESYITQPALDAVLDAAGQGEMAKAASEHGQRSMPAPELNMAFVLYNLSPADRAQMLDRFPPHLLGMIDGPWKPHWAPMKSLLLE